MRIANGILVTLPAAKIAPSANPIAIVALPRSS
jgi:hypothetical protein